jgi:hypothetical protein
MTAQRVESSGRPEEIGGSVAFTAPMHAVVGRPNLAGLLQTMKF